jgi:hypothetical protein|tara:strand:- start:191 stop:322 length:132 start_codon:yes stop_codon:yes gene_type:complete
VAALTFLIPSFLKEISHALFMAKVAIPFPQFSFETRYPIYAVL